MKLLLAVALSLLFSFLGTVLLEVALGSPLDKAHPVVLGFWLCVVFVFGWNTPRIVTRIFDAYRS